MPPRRLLGFLIHLLLPAALFASILQSAHAQTPYTAFQATYYQGKSLEGAPLLTRLEPVINWSYEAGGTPAPGVIPSTDFSARWEGWYYVDHPGPWTFTYTSDDGGRVWLDNQLVIDLWYDHGPFSRASVQDLAVGYHLLRVEYYQNTGGMTSQLTITPPGNFPDWMGEYFDNPYLLGEPRYRVDDAEINFNWGSASPDARIPTDNFSVRWTRLVSFAAGSYTFSATADDGIRVWVGDTLAIDGWIPQQARTYTKTLFLQGTYPLRAEYFEQGGQAVVNLTYTFAATPLIPTANETWRGEFFANADLAPPVTCEQDSPGLDFNWEGASPGCGIGGKFFSARWETTRLTPATGFYTLYLTVDDGARILVDNNLVLDAWREQPPTKYSTTVYLNAGAHVWRVEFFQSTGSGQITLDIVAGVTPRTDSPPASDQVIVDALGAGWTQGGSGFRTASVGDGGSSVWSNNNAFIQPLYNWGRWYPALISPGTYEVSVFVPRGIATTKNARYWIYHSGRFDEVAIPQAAYGDVWVSLGTFAFEGQGGEYVSLSDVTYEPYFSTTVVWDAVRFAPH